MKLNKLKKLVIGSLIAGMAGISGFAMPVMAADNLDTYRELLQAHKYTI